MHRAANSVGPSLCSLEMQRQQALLGSTAAEEAAAEVSFAQFQKHFNRTNPDRFRFGCLSLLFERCALQTHPTTTHRSTTLLSTSATTHSHPHLHQYHILSPLFSSIPPPTRTFKELRLALPPPVRVSTFHPPPYAFSCGGSWQARRAVRRRQRCDPLAPAAAAPVVATVELPCTVRLG